MYREIGSQIPGTPMARPCSVGPRGWGAGGDAIRISELWRARASEGAIPGHGLARRHPEAYCLPPDPLAGSYLRDELGTQEACTVWWVSRHATALGTHPFIDRQRATAFAAEAG